jgi:hypothetical protein
MEEVEDIFTWDALASNKTCFQSQGPSVQMGVWDSAKGMADQEAELYTTSIMMCSQTPSVSQEDTMLKLVHTIITFIIIK